MVQTKQEIMNSREKMLAAVKKNQPARLALPDVEQLAPLLYDDLNAQFTEVLQNIGGSVVTVKSLQEISAYIKSHFNESHHLVTTIAGLDGLKEVSPDADPHSMETVALAVMQAVFGVAENGAIWLSEREIQVRVLPFIAQHLAIVLESDKIVPHMHSAYERIGTEKYGFGVFIAGPSKTADIEQSLVLGAHGPMTMTVFLLTGDA